MSENGAVGALARASTANGQRTSVGGSFARTNLPAPVSSATYDLANRVLTFDGFPASHDHNGNLLSLEGDIYSWDVRNRLAALAGPGLSASFQYDALGRRTKKIRNGQNTDFMSDGVNPLQEQAVAGANWTAVTMTGLGVDKILAQNSAPGLHETTLPGWRSTAARWVRGKKDVTLLPLQPRRSISEDELSYLREALQDDAVVCLDCGARRRALGGHVRIHDLTLDEYRERWGYNRKTPLVSAHSAEKYRQNAFDRNLGAHASIELLAKATEASRHSDNTRRREGVLKFRKTIQRRAATGWQFKPHYKVDDDTLRALAEAVHTRKEIAARTGLGRHQLRKRLQALGFLPSAKPRQPTFTDQQLLKLRAAGLWPSEIAARLGTTPLAVRKRIRKLRQQGMVVAEPRRPAPNGRRRVSNEAFLTLVRKGLSLVKIAARLGVPKSYVIGKKTYLRKRGQLERGYDWHPRTFTDQALLDLCAAGLWPSEIAVQLKATPLAVRKRIRKLRQQGIAVAEPDQLRPQPNGRRMPNEVFIAVVRQGRSLAEVAARLEVSKSYVKAKATYLRRRGLPERSHTWQQRQTP